MLRKQNVNDSADISARHHGFFYWTQTARKSKVERMRDMMGGFFELELPEYGNFPYPESPCCAYVSSGRAAFECLLLNRPRPERIWIPRFICDTVLQAPQRLNIPVARYEINKQLEPILPPAGENDLILLVNYFGLSNLAPSVARLPGRCIVDATTALYTPPLPGVPTFYSPRKFCGVADGGVACATEPLNILPQETALSTRNSLYLLERLENGADAALPASELAENALSAPPCRMSMLTRRLLSSVDFSAAAARRLENYATLHQALKELNHLALPDAPVHAPMCYPLMCGIPGLRDTLIDAGIALPLYWPEVIEATHATDPANKLARRLLPLPLDQRYTKKDMNALIRLILN